MGFQIISGDCTASFLFQAGKGALGCPDRWESSPSPRQGQRPVRQGGCTAPPPHSSGLTGQRAAPYIPHPPALGQEPGQGLLLSWESASFAMRRPAVRFRSAPPGQVETGRCFCRHCIHPSVFRHRFATGHRQMVACSVLDGHEPALASRRMRLSTSKPSSTSPHPGLWSRRITQQQNDPREWAQIAIKVAG